MTKSNYKYMHLKSLQGYGEAKLWKQILKRGNFQLAIANTSQEGNLQIWIFGCHGYVLVYWEVHDFYTLLGWVKKNIFLPILNIVQASTADYGSGVPHQNSWVLNTLTTTFAFGEMIRYLDPGTRSCPLCQVDVLQYRYSGLRGH